MKKSHGSFNPITGEVNLNERGLHAFWSRVKKKGADDCWEWVGTMSGEYGVMRVDYGNIKTHRLAWIIHNGQIPDGLWVLHNCPNGDFPACCNCAHLWLGTSEQNSHDRHIKGRDAKGEHHGLSKLNASKVLDIEKRIGRGETFRSVAGRYGIAIGGISSIIYGKSWQEVTLHGPRNGTPRFGINHHKSKLKEEDIPIIRARRNQGESFTAIAKSYHMDRSSIASAYYGESWAHVT